MSQRNVIMVSEKYEWIDKIHASSMEYFQGLDVPVLRSPDLQKVW